MNFIKDILRAIKLWFYEEDGSPKGSFRMKEALFAGLFLLMITYFASDEFFKGWATQTAMQFAKVTLGLFLYYWIVARNVLHTRTHELRGKDLYKRENTHLVSCAIIIGCALSI